MEAKKLKEVFPKITEELAQKKESSTNLQKLNKNGNLEIAGKSYSPIDFGITFNADYPILLCKKNISILDAHLGLTPKISEVKRILGEKTIEAVISVWLDRLNDFYGKGSLTQIQIDEMASLIISEYYYLKISELAIFFNNFKLGKYGQFYGVIDPLKIMAGLYEFQNERRNAILKYDNEVVKKTEEEKLQSEREKFNEQWKWLKPLLEIIEKITLLD